MEFSREELPVLPSDDPKEKVGWIIIETEGIGVVNTWFTLPWYKKIFRVYFRENLFRRFS